MAEIESRSLILKSSLSIQHFFIHKLSASLIHKYNFSLKGTAFTYIINYSINIYKYIKSLTTVRKPLKT